MKNIKCANCGEEISRKAPTCPKCGHPNKIANHLSGGEFLLYSVIGFAAIWWFVGGSTSGSNAIATQAQAQQEIAALPVITAASIAAAYHENTVAADQQFKDRKFKVSGTVVDINTDIMGDPYITLRGGVNEFMEPHFGFEQSDAAQLAGLRKGSKVKLVCIGKGDIAKTPMSDSCKLL